MDDGKLEPEKNEPTDSPDVEETKSELEEAPAEANEFEKFNEDFDTDEYEDPAEVLEIDPKDKDKVEVEDPESKTPDSALDEADKKVVEEEVTSDTPKKTEAEEVPEVAAVETKPLETPEQKGARDLQRRTESVAKLSQHFKFTDEESELLSVNPGEVLPKILAGMFYDVHEAVLQSVRTSMPSLMGAVEGQRTKQETAKSKFFEQWPDLKDKKYESDIRRVSSFYLQSNPKATQEQFDRDVGAQIMVANKIPFDLATGKKLEAQVEEPRAAAHKPASPTASAALSGAPTENAFEILSEEFLDDDIS